MFSHKEITFNIFSYLVGTDLHLKEKIQLLPQKKRKENAFLKNQYFLILDLGVLCSLLGEIL